jgi:hypothetical protein
MVGLFLGVAIFTFAVLALIGAYFHRHPSGGVASRIIHWNL